MHVTTARPCGTGHKDAAASADTPLFFGTVDGAVPGFSQRSSVVGSATLFRCRCVLPMPATTCLLRVSESYGCFGGESPDLLTGLCALVCYG